MHADSIEDGGQRSVTAPWPDSLRLFRLDSSLAASYSHDVDRLRSLAAQQMPAAFHSSRITPELLDILTPACQFGESCEAQDEMSFVPSRADWNVRFKVRGARRSFSITQVSAGIQINEALPIRLEENGRILFTRVVCQGTYDWPLLYPRLIADRLAFEYLDGRCEAGVAWNTFFDGMDINQSFRVKGSRQLFVYKGTIGFVAREGQKERLFFNHRAVGPAFDCLRGFDHEDPTPPLLDVHDNGWVLFGARQGRSLLVGMLNLNELLPGMRQGHK